VNEAVPPYGKVAVCTACPAGKSNEKDDPMTTASTCHDTTCDKNHFLSSSGKCVACSIGEESSGGSQAVCTAIKCNAGQGVKDNQCIDCNAAAGYVPSTTVCNRMMSNSACTCVAKTCAVNERVQSHKCVACTPGTVNTAGDDATKADTHCSFSDAATRFNTDTNKNLNEHLAGTACGADQHVVNHICLPCPSGTTNTAGDDPNGADTVCHAKQAAPTTITESLCKRNQFVDNHQCKACPKYYYNEAGDDPHHHDTVCKKIYCPVGYYVDTTDKSNHVCTPCATSVDASHPSTLTVASAWIGGPATRCE
jgi:hypothetical protein